MKKDKCVCKDYNLEGYKFYVPNPMEESKEWEEFDEKFGILIYAETSTKMANSHIKQFINDNYISKEDVEKLETYQVSIIPELLGKELIDKNKLT